MSLLQSYLKLKQTGLYWTTVGLFITLNFFVQSSARAAVDTASLELVDSANIEFAHNGGYTDRRTRNITDRYSLNNISGQTLEGPFTLEIIISPSGVTSVINADDTMITGNALIYLPQTTLSPGESINYELTFANPGRTRFNYAQNLYRPASIGPGSNTAPVAADINVTGTEDQPLQIQLQGTDADGDPLSYSLSSQPQNGTLTGIAPDLTYTPDPDFNGPDQFSYKVNDGTEDSDPAVVTITVASVNDPPAANPDTAITNEDTAITINVLVNDTDIDVGETLSVDSVLNVVNGIATVTPDDTITFTPDANFNGTASFNYIAQDNDSAFSAPSAVTITVNPVNDAPAISSTATLTATVSQTYTYDVEATDIEEDALTYSLTTAPAGMSIDPVTGWINWTPDEAQVGDQPITVQVVDGNGGSDSQSYTITVVPRTNTAPIANDIDVTGAEDQPLSIQLSGTDPDNDPLTYTVFTQPQNGALTGAVPNLTYTPNADYNGADSFEFIVTDSSVSSAPSVVNITINPINDAPVSSNVTTGTLEDKSVIITLSGSDLDGDALSFRVATPPANGTLSVNGSPLDSTLTYSLESSNLIYTPSTDYSGLDTFNYILTDGTASSAPSAVNITITPDLDGDGIPDSRDDDRDGDGYSNTEEEQGGTDPDDASSIPSNAPTIDSAPVTSIDEDTLYAYTITATDIDINDIVTLTASILPNWLSFDGTTLSGTPTNADVGDHTVEVVATDLSGATFKQSFIITVSNVNDAPVANDASFTLDEDTVLSNSLIAIDADGDTLSFTLTTPAANGVAAINTDGTFTYTPNADFNGTDSFTFTASDASAQSVPSVVNLTITPINDAPVAPSLSESLSEGGSVIIDLLANATDIDSPSVSIDTFTQPTHGTLTDNGNGTVTYIHDGSENFSDNFEYSVTDGFVSSVSSVVNLSITLFNNPPVASDVTAETLEDTLVEIILSGTDPDGDVLSFQIATPPTNGTLTVNDSPLDPVLTYPLESTLTYMPSTDYSGPDSFNYTLADGSVFSAPSVVNLTINPDLDGDGIIDNLDDDRDGDGTNNAQDTYPDDSTRAQLAVVEGISLSLQDSAVVISWQAHSETALLDAYHIYRQPLNGTETLIGQLSKDAVSYTDDGVANITGYYYRIVAVDNNGNEGQSGNPQPLFVAYNDTSVQALQIERQGVNATLSWTAVAGMRYQLYRSLSGEAAAELVQVDTAAYTDTTVLWDQVYEYQVATLVDVTDVFSNQTITLLGPLSETISLPALSPLGSVEIDDAIAVSADVYELNLLNNTEQVTVTGQFQNAIGSVEITATANGQQTITAQSDDGGLRLILPAISADWQITITEQAVPNRSESIQLNLLADQQVPVISIDGSAERSVDDAFIVLTGTASDNGSGIAELYVRSDRLGEQDFAVVMAANQFSVELPIERGTNVVTVYANDYSGNQASASVMIQRTIDVIPEIIINNPVAGNVFTETLDVEGIVYSSLPAEQLALSLGNEQRFPTAVEENVYAFSFPAVRLTEGFNQLIVRLNSPAGSAQASVGVNYVAETPDPETTPKPEIVLTSPRISEVLNASSVLIAGQANSLVGVTNFTINDELVPLSGQTANEQNFLYEFDLTALADGPLELLLKASDSLNQITELRLPLVIDRQEPTLTLTGIQPAPFINEIVELPYHLQGSVSDANLAALTINDQAVGLLPGAASNEYEISSYLNFLSPGIQTIAVQARDLARNLVNQEFIFDVKASVGIEIISPRDGSEIAALSSGTTIDVAVRLTNLLDDQTVTVEIDQGGSEVMTLDGNAATATLLTTLVDGEHTLHIHILDADSNIVSAVQSRFNLVNVENLALNVARSEPVNGATHVVPNQGVTVYFNQPIDPNLIQIVVKETVHALGYDLSNPGGKSFVDMPDPELIEVHRDMQVVPGGLLYGPDNRFVTFQAERDYAYTGQIFVEVHYNGEILDRFNFEIKPLPTLIIGSVTDQLQTPLEGIPVALPEFGLSTTTESNGNFRLRIEGKTTDVRSGRYSLVYNESQANAAYGSHTVFVDLEAGRLNRLNKQIISQLSPGIPYVTIAGGEQFALDQSQLLLDLSHAQLVFSNGRNQGEVHVQFTTFEQLAVPIDGSVIPHWVYAIQPGEIEVAGTVDVQIDMPAFYGNDDYIPAEGTYVAMVGLDPITRLLTPVGVGFIQNKQVHSLGGLPLERLDYIGYALVGDDAQAVLERYALGEIESLALLRSELVALIDP